MSASAAVTVSSAQFLTQFGPVAWNVLAPARNANHAPRRCPISGQQAVALLFENRSPSPCDDCFDTWFESLCHLLAHRGELETAGNSLALANTITSNHMRDNHNRNRADGFGIAKPLAARGVPARIRKALGTPWLVRVFDEILTAAPLDRPLPADRWGYDHLATVKAQVVGDRTPRPALLRQVRDDVEQVLAVIREIAGQKWLHDYIYAAHSRRQERHPVARIGIGDDGQPTIHPVDSSRPESTGARIRQEFFKHLPTADCVEALRMAGANIAPGRPAADAGTLLEVSIDLLAEIVVAEIGVDGNGRLSKQPNPTHVFAAVSKVCTRPVVLPDPIVRRVIHRLTDGS